MPRKKPTHPAKKERAKRRKKAQPAKERAKRGKKSRAPTTRARWQAAWDYATKQVGGWESLNAGERRVLRAWADSYAGRGTAQAAAREMDQAAQRGQLRADDGFTIMFAFVWAFTRKYHGEV